MQNHRPARSKRKRVRMRWTAPYTSIPHINGPAARAGPSVTKDRSSSAVHAALLLTRARIALLRLARLRLVRIVHVLSPAYWLPQRAPTSTRGTAESCDAKRPIACETRIDISANFRQSSAAD